MCVLLNLELLIMITTTIIIIYQNVLAEQYMKGIMIKPAVGQRAELVFGRQIWITRKKGLVLCC